MEHHRHSIVDATSNADDVSGILGQVSIRCIACARIRAHCTTSCIICTACLCAVVDERCRHCPVIVDVGLELSHQCGAGSLVRCRGRLEHLPRRGAPSHHAQAWQEAYGTDFSTQAFAYNFKVLFARAGVKLDALLGVPVRHTAALLWTEDNSNAQCQFARCLQGAAVQGGLGGRLDGSAIK